MKSKTDKCVFKTAKAEHGEEFFIFTEPAMVEAWRKDNSIPLVDVLQAFTGTINLLESLRN
jgi:ribosome maturation protein Sdo1